MRSWRFHLFTTIWPWPSFDRLYAAQRELWRIDSLAARSPNERLFYRFYRARFEQLSTVRFNGAVPWKARIGEGTRFAHGFNGVHIAHDAVIGRNCLIFQNVTVGLNIGSDGVYSAAPVIGDDVLIGAGASIIGNCVIGDGARIGAGVVLTNVTVPPGAVIVNKSAYDLTNKRFIYPQD